MTIITTSRKVAALATAAALATSLAACGSGDAGTSTAGTSASGDGAVSGTVSLLTPIFEGSSGKELLEGTPLPAISAKYSDVKVTVDYTSYATLNILVGVTGVARMDLLAEAGFDHPPTTVQELRDTAKALTLRDASGTMTRAGFDVQSIDPRQVL